MGVRSGDRLPKGNTVGNVDPNEEVVRLIAQYQRQLLLYIRSLVPERTDAEEVLQEVTVFLWRNAGEYKSGTNFGAWAYKTAFNHVRTWRKRQGRSKLMFSDALLDRLADEAEAMADAGDRRREALEQCIQKLDPQNRDLVRLRYESEASMDEVAKRVGRSVPTAYRVLNTIHLSLMECVQRRLREEGA
jgi:RNA polymerase sigma-70 factor (ECF subfamily)